MSVRDARVLTCVHVYKITRYAHRYVGVGVRVGVGPVERRRDMLRTSSYVDDVMVFYNRPCGRETVALA